MKQRAEIVFEKEETILLRKSSAITNEFCPGCQAYSVMASPEAIAIMADVSERRIFRMIEAGKVHFVEGRKIYVCLNSLAAIKGEIKQ